MKYLFRITRIDHDYLYQFTPINMSFPFKYGGFLTMRVIKIGGAHNDNVKRKGEFRFMVILNNNM